MERRRDEDIAPYPKLMNIGGNGRSLVMLTKQLSLQWQQTKSFWRDAKALEFERKFLFELTAAVDRAAPVFDDLDKLVTKVRTDCE